jgi:hypothetical protein
MDRLLRLVVEKALRRIDKLSDELSWLDTSIEFTISSENKTALQSSALSAIEGNGSDIEMQIEAMSQAV